MIATRVSGTMAAAVTVTFGMTSCAPQIVETEQHVALVRGVTLEVFSSTGPRDGSIYSVIRDENGAPVEHGLRVTTDHGWLREATVHDHGVLIRHFQFHRNGYPFIMKYMDAAGDGFVQIWNDASEVIYSGMVEGGARWSGEFMVPEFIPNTYGERQIMLHGYKDGALVRREPFPFERAGVAPPDHRVDPRNWPWVWGDWPAPAFISAPEAEQASR